MSNQLGPAAKHLLSLNGLGAIKTVAFLTPALNRALTNDCLTMWFRLASDIIQYEQATLIAALRFMLKNIIENYAMLCNLSDAILLGIRKAVLLVVLRPQRSFSFSKLIMVCPSPLVLNIRTRYFGVLKKKIY